MNTEIIKNYQHKEKQLNTTKYKRKYLNGMELKYYKENIVITSTLQLEIVEWYHHNLNRPGTTRTHRTIANHFYFPLIEKIHQFFCKEMYHLHQK